MNDEISQGTLLKAVIGKLKINPHDVLRHYTKRRYSSLSNTISNIHHSLVIFKIKNTLLSLIVPLHQPPKPPPPSPSNNNRGHSRPWLREVGALSRIHCVCPHAKRGRTRAGGQGRERTGVHPRTRLRTVSIYRCGGGTGR